MSPDLDKKLVETFPNLYADRFANMQQTAMCWGFECGDGWFDIIWELSHDLELLIIDLQELEPDQEYYPKASQVKEKYGTLRFYMTSETDEMSDLIATAEKKSAETCEKCGQKGEVYMAGWCVTRCYDCVEKSTIKAELNWYKQQLAAEEAENNNAF